MHPHQLPLGPYAMAGTVVGPQRDPGMVPPRVFAKEARLVVLQRSQTINLEEGIKITAIYNIN